MRPIRTGLFLACAAFLAVPDATPAQAFRLSFPASVHAAPVTGRLFLFVARRGDPEPRLQSGAMRRSEPFFGVDVEALAPGRAVTIDAGTPGFPVASLRQLPAGEYFVQGLLAPYTQFHRADGPTT